MFGVKKSPEKAKQGLNIIIVGCGERAVEAARYIVERKATVRQAAKELGISKSTVHMVVTK